MCHFPNAAIAGNQIIPERIDASTQGADNSQTCYNNSWT